MLVVTRHVVPVEDAPAFLESAREALAVLADCPGYVEGAVGRAVDDPALLLISTRWDSVGSYRRALSAYDVKLRAVPLLSTAIDEPSAFEVLHARDRDGAVDTPGALAADHHSVGLGAAAAPSVPRLPS